MKKVLVVVLILIITISAGVAEILVTDRVYEKLHLSLKKVELSMSENPKKFDNPETIELIEETLRIWERHREYIFMVNNHVIMRNLNEKLVMLESQIRINADQDAPVTLASALSYLSELKEDNHPQLINIL